MKPDTDKLDKLNYCYVKLVQENGNEIVKGCREYTVVNPDDDTIIFSETEGFTLSIPRDGVTFYIMNREGDTTDRYPRSPVAKNKNKKGRKG